MGIDVVQAQVDALPDGRLVTFPDLGHFGPLEALRSVAASILETVAPRR
jgi:pimeloyl-ACP methyl ester carboxylesterase